MRTRLPAMLAVVFGLLAAGGITSSADGQDRPTLDERLLQAAGFDPSAPALLDFFRRRSPCEDRQKKIPELIGQLAEGNFRLREEATEELIALGRAAVPALQTAAKSTDPEVGYRAGRCLVVIAAQTDTETTVAAVRVLAAHNPPESVEVLLRFLASAGDATVEEEVSAALVAIAVRDGRPHAALVEAAGSDREVQRSAAAAVLARSAAAEHRLLARALLADPEPRVRWQAARSLLAARDKAAVPALVGLVGEGPLALARLADDLLFRVAGDKAPAAGLGQGDAESRKKCRAAWADWWQANEAVVDLAQLNWKVEIDPDLSRLIDHSSHIAREALAGAAADKRAAHKARLAATMIAIYAQSGPGGAATPLRATLRDSALALAASIQAGRYDEAAKQLRALPSLYPDRRARMGTVPIVGKHIEFEEVMYYFSVRGSGFEKQLYKLQETAKERKLVPAALNDELLAIATHVGVIADIAHHYQIEQKNKQKDWEKKADDLRQAARALATAVKAHQAGDAFSAVSRVNVACSNCHDVYR